MLYPEQLIPRMKISFFYKDYGTTVIGIVRYACRSYIDVDGITYATESMFKIKVIK